MKPTNQFPRARRDRVLDWATVILIGVLLGLFAAWILGYVMSFLVDVWGIAK